MSCVYKRKYYFTTKQYRIKGFFSGVHACVHGADALTHTLSAPFWEMVMLRKQDTLILSELYINDQFVLSEPWMRFELTTLVMIGTDSCKSNYHMITTTPRWHINVVKTIITLIEILHHTFTILWYQEDESILNNNKK